MWDLPGPGIKPESPALAGAFFTTEPPGKPVKLLFAVTFLDMNNHSKELFEFVLIWWMLISLMNVPDSIQQNFVQVFTSSKDEVKR